MGKCVPTVRINHPDGDGYLIINQTDFNEKVHTLYEEPSGSLGADEVPEEEPSRPAALDSPEAWSGANAEACIKALSTIDRMDALEALATFESGDKGKKRKTVLDAIERRRKAIA